MDGWGAFADEVLSLEARRKDLSYPYRGPGTEWLEQVVASAGGRGDAGDDMGVPKEELMAMLGAWDSDVVYAKDFRALTDRVRRQRSGAQRVDPDIEPEGGVAESAPPPRAALGGGSGDVDVGEDARKLIKKFREVREKVINRRQAREMLLKPHLDKLVKQHPELQKSTIRPKFLATISRSFVQAQREWYQGVPAHNVPPLRILDSSAFGKHVRRTDKAAANAMSNNGLIVKVVEKVAAARMRKRGAHHVAVTTQEREAASTALDTYCKTHRVSAVNGAKRVRLLLPEVEELDVGGKLTLLPSKWPDVTSKVPQTIRRCGLVEAWRNDDGQARADARRDAMQQLGLE